MSAKEWQQVVFSDEKKFTSTGMQKNLAQQGIVEEDLLSSGGGGCDGLLIFMKI